jgi:copper chaperone
MVQNVEIDMKKQRVYVTSTLSSDELLEIIKKAGKATSYIGTA